MSSKSPSLRLNIRVCTESGAVYLGVREHLKVARTEVVQQWPLLAVDYSKTGAVVGVESVGANEIRLQSMLNAAGLKLSVAMLQQAMIRHEASDLERVVA